PAARRHERGGLVHRGTDRRRARARSLSLATARPPRGAPLRRDCPVDGDDQPRLPRPPALGQRGVDRDQPVALYHGATGRGRDGVAGERRGPPPHGVSWGRGGPSVSLRARTVYLG